MGEQPLKDNPAWLVIHALDSARAIIDSLWQAAQEAEYKAKAIPTATE